MPRRRNIKTTDDRISDLEARQTQAHHTIDRLETDRRVLELSLLRRQRLYQDSPIGFITCDEAGRVVDINDAAVRLLHITPAGAIGIEAKTLFDNESAGAFVEHFRKARRSGGKSVSVEVQAVVGKGTPLNLQLVTSSMQIEAGRIFETAVIDITAQKIAAESLARAREYAESVVATIPYPLLVLDQRGRVVSANAAFYYAFQTSERQVVGWPLMQLPDVSWISPELERALPQALVEGRAVDGLIVRAEIQRGSSLTLSVNARRLSGETDAKRDYFLVAFEDITRRMQAEGERELFLTELQESQVRLEARVSERTHELVKSYGQLRSVGEQLILAHESEQRRIARELHDQVGQDLTALKIALARGKNSSAEVARETLKEAEALTNELLQTVRNICSTLRPQVLDDLGLVQGLQWHIKTFAARTGLDITFDIGPFDESRLSPIIKTTIFRVMQEALTNVSRHAQTKAASAILAMRKGHIEFSVRDGGKGFDSSEAKFSESTGISGMRERVSLVGGKFEISSSPGNGSIINVQIPILRETSTNSETNRTINNGKRTKDQNRYSRGSSPRAQGTQIAA